MPFVPESDFRGASFTIGRSDAQEAIASCLRFEDGTTEVTRFTDEGKYATFVYGRARDGVITEITSNRVLHNEFCYALEYTIAATEGEGVGAFDRNQVLSLLELMADSFVFGSTQ